MILGQMISNCEAENSQVLRTCLNKNKVSTVTLEITFDQATATPLKVTFKGFDLHGAFLSNYKFN